MLLQIYLQTISQNCTIGIAIRIGFTLVLAQKCRMKTWILYIPLEIHEHTEESLIACLPGWQLHRTSHSSGMPWCSTRRCTGRMNGKDLIWWSCLIRTRFQAFSAQRLCQLHDLNVCVCEPNFNATCMRSHQTNCQFAWHVTGQADPKWLRCYSPSSSTARFTGESMWFTTPPLTAIVYYTSSEFRVSARKNIEDEFWWVLFSFAR